ncbi:hypothetical protein [Streptomyces avermitilis]|uniref:hypothetical protein n=1 Tax=Streptomyces avermitilis TaxID=33903 RepID=UPI0036A01CF6
MAIAPVAVAATVPQPSTSVAQGVKGPKPPTPPTVCAALSGQLSTQLQAAATALAATPPNVPAAQAAIAAAQVTVAQLRANGCLPAAPPTPPTCAALTLQLQAQLQVLAAALAANPQDPAAITAAFNAVVATAAQLAAVCV